MAIVSIVAIAAIETIAIVASKENHPHQNEGSAPLTDALPL